MDQGRLYTFYESDPAPVVAFLRFVHETGDLPEHPHVLDLGCGPGRLLEPLHRLNWRVTGDEPDPDYARVARERARGLEGVSVREAGFSDLADRDCFDLIASMNGPFSYLLTAAERRDAVARCAAALRPGGILVLDLANFWWILKNYREPPELVLDIDGVEVTRTATHEFDFQAGVMTHHDRFVWVDGSGEDQEAAKTHRMALVTFPELEEQLTESGFTDLRTFTRYEDREPRPLDGKRMLVTARRPTRD